MELSSLHSWRHLSTALRIRLTRSQNASYPRKVRLNDRPLLLCPARGLIKPCRNKVVKMAQTQIKAIAGRCAESGINQV